MNENEIPNTSNELTGVLEKSMIYMKKKIAHNFFSFKICLRSDINEAINRWRVRKKVQTALRGV